MSQIVIKSSSKTANWVINKRHKVGNTVIYNDGYWTNITGANSEPGSAADDWLFVASTTSSVATITINGNLFRLYKHTANNDPTKRNVLEVNDSIVGYWDANTFFTTGIYIGGDNTLKASYNDQNSVEDIVPI